ncbi:MAG: hypothetical protein HY461_02280 [Parcubacteria group bacterium]|nr:hypothetical protein [Parcubacteria group bacterium]
MHRKHETNLFFHGLISGAVFTSSLLMAAFLYGFATDEWTGLSDTNPAFAQEKLPTRRIKASARASQVEAWFGAKTSIGGVPYLVVQELANPATGLTARLLAIDNDLNRDRLELARINNYSLDVQCLNGNEWFGNKGINKGGPVLLTVWDKEGEQLVAFDDTSLQSLNTYSGCVRLRQWYKGRLVFELADLRHADIRRHYFGYRPSTGEMDLLYGYETYAAVDGETFLAVWLSEGYEQALIQRVGREGAAGKLYRVPYLDLGALLDLEHPTSLEGYPVALDTTQALTGDLSTEESLTLAGQGILVQAGLASVLVNWL